MLGTQNRVECVFCLPAGLRKETILWQEYMLVHMAAAAAIGIACADSSGDEKVHPAGSIQRRKESSI